MPHQNHRRKRTKIIQMIMHDVNKNKEGKYMNYVDEKTQEIIEANGNKETIKDILCDIYVSVQMDSSIRDDFEIEIEKYIR